MLVQDHGHEGGRPENGRHLQVPAHGVDMAHQPCKVEQDGELEGPDEEDAEFETNEYDKRANHHILCEVGAVTAGSEMLAVVV